MIISKHFTLQELTKSNTATRLGIENKPNKEQIHKLRLLAAALLQPLRNAVGPLRVSSGYRSKELNKAIGGSPNSQPCKAEAVDLQHFYRGKMHNLRIYQQLICNDLPFDQCILEFGGATATKNSNNPDWIHLSYSLDYNRRQVLVAYKDVNNRTTYREL